MIDVDKRKKWNYKDTSSAQYNQYVDRMNAMHPSATERYPGEHLFQFARAPRSKKEAQQMLMQQQMLEYAQNQAAMRQMGAMSGYSVPIVPPTPVGMMGMPTYNPYTGFRR